MESKIITFIKNKLNNLQNFKKDNLEKKSDEYTEDIRTTENTEGIECTENSEGIEGTNNSEGIDGTENSEGIEGTNNSEGIDGTENSEDTENASADEQNNSNKDIDIELIELISNILDKNPEFFILIEKVLLDLVKDNELNLTIFNYAYIIDSITKISVIYNNLNLDDLKPLLNNKNYFFKIIKWTIDVVIKNNSGEISESDIVIDKLNVLINSYKDFINIFKN